MQSVIIIPARYGSSRFPGKPLAPIKGISLLERTWRIAKQAAPDLVVIATDDDRIEAAATRFGAEVVRTSADCANGTERVHAALSQIKGKPEIILNLQGDAVLTPPWILTDMLDAMRADKSIQIATPATKLSLEQYKDLANQKASGIVGGTLVVFDKYLNAMYFSKSPIPFVRSTKADADLPLYRHIGLYGYSFDALQKYLQLPQGPLEQIEGLEQLRALENGVPIRIVVVDYRGRTHWSVDSPDDIVRVERIIAEQGELLDLVER